MCYSFFQTIGKSDVSILIVIQNKMVINKKTESSSMNEVNEISCIKRRVRYGLILAFKN